MFKRVNEFKKELNHGGLEVKRERERERESNINCVLMNIVFFDKL